MVLDRAAHFPSGPRVRATETMKITEIIEMGRREIETPPAHTVPASRRELAQVRACDLKGLPASRGARAGDVAACIPQHSYVARALVFARTKLPACAAVSLHSLTFRGDTRF